MAEAVRVLERVKSLAPPAAPKLVSPGELLQRVEELYDQIAKRAFEIFEGNGRAFGHDLEDWFKAESELLHPAHVNVSETEKEVGVCAEVPGFAANELEVSVDGTRLTIAGKRETTQERKEGKTTYQEQCSNQLLRVIDLPATVDTAKAEATLQNGVLELKLAKAAPAKKIAIGTKAS